MSSVSLPAAALWAISVSGVLFAQNPAPVPSEYQDLYSSLNAQLSAFQATIPAGGTYPTDFAAELVSANSSRGPELLSTPYSNFLMELDSLNALGVKAVKVGIHFPILYPGYYANPSAYQQYLSLYQQLAKDIHARNLKLIVETGLLINEPGISDTNAQSFYNSLTEQQYEAGRAQVAVTIAQQLQPDYLSVLNEPDTEALQSGKSDLGTPAGSLAFLNVILNALQQANVKGIPIGAGTGTWQSSYSAYIQNFASAPIQFIDMHIFPVNQSFLANAADIASLAHSYGKGVAVSQAWLQKVRDSELGVLDFPQLAARDPFSFWQPLDTSFLQTMASFSRANQLLFFSPFFSAYFHAYTDYASSSSLSVDQLMALEYQQFAQNLSAGQYTQTGEDYSSAILSQADTTPPSVPNGISTAAGTSAISLTWNASTDNVGVAGYSVFRNGSLIGTTLYPVYYDLNLPATTTFTYTISAYDAAGNASALSSAISATTLTPPNNTPPSVPQGLNVQTAFSSQVSLAWSPSSSSNGLSGYLVYRGSSPSSLTLIAGASQPFFADTRVSPSTTYYYSVLAYDVQGNKSALSNIVAAVTPQEAPPSVPANLTGQAPAYNQVNLSWAASTSTTGMGGYVVYRGTSASALSIIASTTTASFADTKVAPNMTFYYAIAAYDIYGLRSAPSATIAVRTPASPPPTVPNGLTAVVASATQVNLGWAASTAAAGMGGYLVYKGTSPSNLSIAASVTGTSYVDTNVSPWVTYYYAVQAYDKYGSRSALSQPVWVNTLAQRSGTP